jgi:hypothetical protein
MIKSGKANYAELYADAVVSLGPFSIKKMGLISNQTLLKLDTYNLVCVPYRISMKGIVLLGSFSRDEMAFFQRFKGSLAGLSLLLQPADASSPIKVFCRCSLAQMGPMKGRESVGIISADFKPCPPDLENAIGDYLMFLDRLRLDYNDLKGKVVPITPDSAKIMGFNNYATLTSGSIVVKLALFSLSADRVEFLAPMKTPDLKKGDAATMRLFFQKYQFNVTGKISETTRLPTGVQRGCVSIDFSPELVDLLGSYYLQAKVGSKRPIPQS